MQEPENLYNPCPRTRLRNTLQQAKTSPADNQEQRAMKCLTRSTPGEFQVLREDFRERREFKEP